MEMDDRQLKGIGITPEQAEQEHASRFGKTSGCLCILKVGSITRDSLAAYHVAA